MIIDLNNDLYVIDDRSDYHRIKLINLLEKIVVCEDGEEFEYSTTPITVTIKSN